MTTTTMQHVLLHVQDLVQMLDTQALLITAVLVAASWLLFARRAAKVGMPVSKHSESSAGVDAATSVGVEDLLWTRNGTVVDVLRWRAQRSPHKLLHTFLNDKGTSVRAQLTYCELLEKAEAVATMLRNDAGVRKGDRIILCYPPGLDFAVGFWGCLMSGAIAIPMYPPYPGTLAKDLEHFNKLADDAQARVVLTNREYEMASKLGTFRSYFSKNKGASWPKGLVWLCSDSAPRATFSDPPVLGPDDTAFFQYSSGSTSAPKAVVISHGNIRSQLRTWDSIDPKDTLVSWLPSYHDMGLVGFIIVPAFTASHCVSMSPLAFIKDASVWARVMSKYSATHCCAPNFGYALAARKTSDAVRDRLDLSCLRQAICAAEPIREAALDAFCAKFGPAGFQRKAFNCGYGLAEVTLTCTGHDPRECNGPTVLRLRKRELENDRVAVNAELSLLDAAALKAAAADDPDVAVLIGCGSAAPEQRVQIVDANSKQALPENRVGEIWVSSESVSVGYWGRPQLTKSTFGNLLQDTSNTEDCERQWLRTGDLGFMRNGELFVTGRMKDLIIVHGRNVMPQDLELTVEAAAAAIRPGCSAAFSVERGNEEHVVIVAEVRGPMADSDLAAAAKSIRASISAQHQLSCEVALIKPRTIPKTTSGKIQRSRCRQCFLDGTLQSIFAGRPSAGTGAAPKSVPKPKSLPTKPDAPKAKGGKTAEDVEAWLREQLVRRLVDGAEDTPSTAVDVDMDAPWAEIGLDSVSAVNLSAELGEWLGTLVPPAAFFAFESPRALAHAPGLLTGELDLPEDSSGSAAAPGCDILGADEEVPSSWHCFEEFDEVQQLRGQIGRMEAEGLRVPYLKELNQAVQSVNFNTYNYLGFSKDETVKAASKEAVDVYGTSMCSSPIVGQTSVNVQLEHEICSFMRCDAACLFIGGWQANVTTIDVLVGNGDLVLCDSLNHNCCVTGQKLSGATVIPFPHNDYMQADKILTAVRRRFRRVLIVIEGVYSMDGDIPDLPQFVELKKRHKALLFVDEAHSLGTLGKTGHGITEHFGIETREVDVLMGTLSKAFGSCGGFIAGSKALVDLLKFTAGGFVFSVGSTPAAAAAALTSLRKLQREPERVSALRERGALFMQLARARKLDIGRAVDGSPVIPIVVGSTHKCVRISQMLAEKGIDVKPIVYPAVEENMARLRFFMSYLHTPEQIERTVNTVAQMLASLDS